MLDVLPTVSRHTGSAGGLAVGPCRDYMRSMHPRMYFHHNNKGLTRIYKGTAC